MNEYARSETAKKHCRQHSIFKDIFDYVKLFILTCDSTNGFLKANSIFFLIYKNN